MIAHVNHCSVLMAECDSSENPGALYIKERPTELGGKAVYHNLTKTINDDCRKTGLPANHRSLCARFCLVTSNRNHFLREAGGAYWPCWLFSAL